MEKEDNDLTSLSPFDRLPFEIAMNILTRLPIKSVLRCRAVCKPWCSAIDAPKFSFLHFSYSVTESGNNPSSSLISLSVGSNRNLYIVEEEEEEEEEGEGLTLNSSTISLNFHQTNDLCHESQSPLYLVGSYNGLICLCSWNKCRKSGHFMVYIFNPTTGKVISLPDITPLNSKKVLVSSGFGFDSSAKKFKVVMIFQVSCADNDPFETEVQVFTLGSNSWRKISFAPDVQIPNGMGSGLFAPDVQIPNGMGSGVFVNESLHWLLLQDVGIFSIVSFDIGHERFGVVSTPVEMVPQAFDVIPVDLNRGIACTSSHLSRIGVLGGFLCLTYFPHFSSEIEIWIMKDYNVRESWMKEFDVDTQPIRRIHGGHVIPFGLHSGLPYCVIHPVCFLENGEIVLLYNTECVVSYDHTNGTASPMLDHEGPGTSLQALPYVRSLISPNQPA